MKVYIGIIAFLYIGRDEIHMYMQYEVSMTVCVGRVSNQRKVPKWLPFKNFKSKLFKSNQHILLAYAHIHTKYKVSMTVYVGM